MKIFKTVDEKFEMLGFKKTHDDKYTVRYEKEDKEHGFVQVIALCHKASGRHLLFSYDKDLYDEKGLGNTCVGLTYTETKLALKKMKQKGWQS